MNSASGLHDNFEQVMELVQEGECLKIIRREPGKFERGKWVSSHRVKEFEAQCCFQPMSGRETQQLPEGDRLKSHVKVYTEFLVLRDDIIERNGERYEVQLVNIWGTFTKSIARLMDVERD